MNNSFMVCNSCKEEIDIFKIRESLQKTSNGIIHIRGEFPRCNSFIKFIPYKESIVIRDLLRLTFQGSLEALINLRNTIIYDEKEREIR